MTTTIAKLRRAKNQEAQTEVAISKIKVEKLFGLYNYSLPNHNGAEIDKLLIIYGDNGTGKTTILKLFFYLLSTRDKSGYKTMIAKTKFKKFAVEFQNGFEIGALRQEASLGSFEYYVARHGNIIKSMTMKSTSDNSIIMEPGSSEDDEYQELIVLIMQLNITTFFLSDDRKILNSLTSSGNERDEPSFVFNDSDLNFAAGYERIEVKKLINERKIAFEPTIERLIDWIRNRVIYGSKLGDKNSQVIFSDIIKDYINLSDSESNLKDKNTLNKELDALSEKLPQYVHLGLIEDLDIKSIKTSIRKARTTEQVRFLSTVITPFIESINAKLNALQNVTQTLTLFIATVNDYFTNKEIHFHLAHGFSLHQVIDGEPVDFNWLSSGEKQLLLLLINTITSADAATIFIIDEPEISLNIKWQRKLIKTLLAFSTQKNIQFILATHSFELLSTYKNSISKLVNEDA